jgi:Flp pilus assembly pilin Flp
MWCITRNYVLVRENLRQLRKGQTMTEYALILAAVAIVVFVTYKTMGNNIGTLAQEIDNQLLAAAS